MNLLRRAITKARNTLDARHYRSRFRQFGTNSYILKPLVIYGHENISVADNVLIAHSVWLNAVGANCKLQIGAGSNLGHFNHISASGEVIIEEEVLTADKVFISDHVHGFEDISVSILKQPIVQRDFVRIGKGSWLGENVCVIGCSIGRHCVIGANAVVTKNIPDYSVAVGNPAKIIKRYCGETKTWRRTSADGNFID